MDIDFPNEEKLYRAVQPFDMFWKENGTVSSAAFHDKRGLSVDRGDFRTDVKVAEAMIGRGLKGRIVSFFVKDCRDVNAIVLYKPEDMNLYHSEIHRNKTKPALTKSQMKHLARRSKIV